MNDECEHDWRFCSEIPVVDTIPEQGTFQCRKCGKYEVRDLGKREDYFKPFGE